MKWTIAPAASFAQYASQWRALNAATLATPLLEPEFVTPLLAHFGKDEVLAHCEHGGETVAMALLTRRRATAWETFQPSQAPVGMWLQQPGLDTAALMAGLMRALPGVPLVVSLLQRDPALETRPAGAGALSTMDYIATARVTVAGSFDDYWAARGKNLRANLKKQRTRLAREGIATRIDVVTGASDAAAAIDDYARLEQSGWKAGQGTAVHTSTAQGRFYRALFESACARGEGRIYRYWFGDQLVAMDLCLAVNGTVIILKTAYDAAAPQGLSPTLLMREEQFRALFDGGAVRAIEFYGKVMEWHTRWTDEVRTMYHVTAFRWPVLGALKQLLKARPRRQAARPDTGPASD
ncbi:GNAT family N-acetyltransferase [Massilia soli]|uniref:GNAT family N-acetyltransferase n=1 Tax=Massilia soli TaxID=2792854 RepID=A0ABS7SIR4_9BURK|nr:GNAT family N-acetyltransferase [Massilia soli]MBZ2206094.1 GNAT family N-acetyltransferase [Massilia soli]